MKDRKIVWIIIEDMFDGTVNQFRDCFFSNVDAYTIKVFADQMECKYEITYEDD